jgi:hypothetical protein
MDGFRYVAVRHRREPSTRYVWFIVPADTRKRERTIHPSRIPAYNGV